MEGRRKLIATHNSKPLRDWRRERDVNKDKPPRRKKENIFHFKDLNPIQQEMKDQMWKKRGETRSKDSTLYLANCALEGL